MTNKINLDSTHKNTWCPGCGNFAILNAYKEAVTEIIKEKKMKQEDFVVSAGIGCHGKLIDFLKLNSFDALHGRTVAVATGVKIANPKLIVTAFTGDGDAYAEGVAHIVHAAKRNSNINVLVHDNSVFALTTGQFTPTSKKGYQGKSTPYGSLEKPINPLKLLLSSGATFVARGSSTNPVQLKKIIKRAMLHKGFSVVNILQPCVVFNNTWEYLSKNVYEIKGHDEKNYEKAYKKVSENSGKIPLGVFYCNDKEISFEEQI